MVLCSVRDAVAISSWISTTASYNCSHSKLSHFKIFSFRYGEVFLYLINVVLIRSYSMGLLCSFQSSLQADGKAKVSVAWLCKKPIAVTESDSYGASQFTPPTGICPGVLTHLTHVSEGALTLRVLNLKAVVFFPNTSLPMYFALLCMLSFHSQVDQSSRLGRRQDRCRQSPWSPAKRNLTPLRLSNSSFFYIADHVARDLSLLSLLKLHLVLTITQTVYRPKVV